MGSSRKDTGPGELCESDFTHLPGVGRHGQAIPHLIYHFVLTCSNWETGTIGYSETFESFKTHVLLYLTEQSKAQSAVPV